MRRKEMPTSNKCVSQKRLSCLASVGLLDVVVQWELGGCASGHDCLLRGALSLERCIFVSCSCIIGIFDIGDLQEDKCEAFRSLHQGRYSHARIEPLFPT